MCWNIPIQILTPEINGAQHTELPSHRPRRWNCAGVTKGGEVRQLCSSEESRRKFLLTRNCSRCLSDSGVNSADMGMISPARIMIALRDRSRQSLVYLETQLLPLDEVCEEVSVQHVLRLCVAQSVWVLECVNPTCCPLRSRRTVSPLKRQPQEQCSHRRRCRMPSPALSAHPEHKHTMYPDKIPCFQRKVKKLYVNVNRF